MGEPTDTTPWDFFEVRTLGVQESVVFLAMRVSNRDGALERHLRLLQQR